MVHPGHHQHLAIRMVLNNCRDQAVGVVLQIIKGVGHSLQFTGMVGLTLFGPRGYL